MTPRRFRRRLWWLALGAFLGQLPWLAGLVRSEPPPAPQPLLYPIRFGLEPTDDDLADEPPLEAVTRSTWNHPRSMP